MAESPSVGHIDSALLTALTTEHFVLQTAASSTISEAAARSSLYVFTLSSSLVAMGFTSQSPDVFMPFVAAVLPAIYLLGALTVVRLLDTTIENIRCLIGIARVRRHYRSLSPNGDLLGGDQVGVALACGAVAMVVLTLLFLAYERWRFSSDPVVRKAEDS